jgi:hypothetical protein
MARGRQASGHSHALRHLAHLVALTSEGHAESAEDNLVASTMALDETVVMSDGLVRAVHGYFGLGLQLKRIDEALARLEVAGTVHRTPSDAYELSVEMRTLIRQRAAEAGVLERRVPGGWLAGLSAPAAIGDGPVRRSSGRHFRRF